MARSTWPRGRAAAVFALVALVAILAAPLAPVAAAQSQPQSQPAQRPATLHVSPESRPAGTAITISGSAQPNAPVDLQWLTWDGSYQTETTAETVAYKQRTFADKRVDIGTVMADGQGQFTSEFTVPGGLRPPPRYPRTRR